MKSKNKSIKNLKSYHKHGSFPNFPHICFPPMCKCFPQSVYNSNYVDNINYYNVETIVELMCITNFYPHLSTWCGKLTIHTVDK